MRNHGLIRVFLSSLSNIIYLHGCAGSSFWLGGSLLQPLLAVACELSVVACGI